MAKLGKTKVIAGIIVLAVRPEVPGSCVGCLGYENGRYPCSILPDCEPGNNEHDVIWKRKGSR